MGFWIKSPDSLSKPYIRVRNPTIRNVLATKLPKTGLCRSLRMPAYKWESRRAVYRDVYCRRAFIYTNGLCRVNQSQLYIIHTSTVCLHLHIQFIFCFFSFLKIMWSNQQFVGFLKFCFYIKAHPSVHISTHTVYFAFVSEWHNNY